MSQLISYIRNLLNPKENKDRKRKRRENHTEVPQYPKYRRVSNVFPERYGQLADDEIDHFQLVKNSQRSYNEILENFRMSQQRKHFEMINDEEFSDDEELSSVRVPTATSRFPNSQKPSTSGYNFSASPQSFSSYNFAQGKLGRQNDVQQFLSTNKKAVPSLRRAMPSLVPIARSAHPQQSVIPNGITNGAFKPEPRRRSVLNFTQKNRAFNDSPVVKPASVIDRCHNIKVRNDYDNLLKTLLPKPQLKSTSKQTNDLLKYRNEPIETVDLSHDETELLNSASSSIASYLNRPSMPPLIYRHDNLAFKKTSAFVEVSDDEDIEPSSFDRHPFISSTLMKAKQERSGFTSSRIKSPTSPSTPEIAPVNSLRDRQQSRNCLQNDAISSIVQKYSESRKRNESSILEAKRTVSQLSNDTATQEKLQQRKLDEAVTSLRQCIILDEEEEKVDEFPAFTEQMLRVISFGLHGPRNDVLVSKFNMTITRNDLNTLDGLNWLNDEVINFYMELIRERSSEVAHLPKVHAMNTFFIPKLLSTGHSGVRRWTRKVDIFSFDIIPIPVHVGGVHWCMSIIDFREKTIRYYDSMGHPNLPVLDALRRYLEDESMDKRKIVFDTSDWKVECIRDIPQQKNGSDCGVFSCMFAEFLTRDSEISFEQQHMQYFRRKMVLEIITGKLILGY